MRQTGVYGPFRMLPNEEEKVEVKVDKTKLDINDPQHQMLISILTIFIDDYGYHPRELYQLMNHAQSMLWPSFMEMYIENQNGSAQGGKGK